jgi:hypothetical protein
MKVKPGASGSNYGPPLASDATYRLVYASNYVRERLKSPRAEHPPEIDVPDNQAYIRLQSHWGSGVTFTTVEITPH